MKSHFLQRAFTAAIAGILTACGISFAPFSVNAAQPVTDGVTSTVTSGMFAADSLDNTWLFGGGVETQGRFLEIGGIRNYIGQFEEYVRWEKRVNSVREGMQRYTINAGKAGQDAATFADNLDGYIASIQPKAVSYLVGPEDYSQGANGIIAFEDAISTIIETSLDMKNGTGYAVIQLPHAQKDEQASEFAALYAESVQAVAADIAAYRQADAGRIAIVDHYSLTNNDSFKNNMLTEDGLLNADGHYQIARQFSQEVYGSVDGFPQISGNWQAEDAPAVYTDTAPTVTASQNALYVTVPKEVAGDSWAYILETEGVTISGAASGRPFTVSGLTEGTPYLLTVRTSDHKIQLPQVEGTVSEGSHAKTPKPEKGIPQKIRRLADNKDKPLTWLFMGDSITHAAAHTHGYDGIAQLFEKYLKEDLGRTDDFVINTAVSGATAQRTIENIEQRMVKYVPDIVSIMLGTNDQINNDYKNNLKRIVAAIREVNPNAVIIFRTPTPATREYGQKIPGENGSLAYMKSAADEDGDILFIDQYTEWNKEFTAYPYLYNAAFYLGDGFIHPGAAGQVHMFRQFIRDCGLNTGTRTANLSYRFSYSMENCDATPNAAVSGNSITVRKQELQTAYGNGEIGDLKLTLTDSDGRTYTKSISPDENNAVIQNLPISRHYTLSASAYIKGSTPKLVMFAPQSITLSTKMEAEALKAILADYTAVRKGNLTIYTDESASVFRDAFDAAQKAIDCGETDVEILAKLYTDLEQAKASLTKKTVSPTPSDPAPPNGSQGSEPTPPAPQIIRKGQSYDSGNYRYKVTSTSKLTVEITGSKNKKLKKISVPNSISLGGKSYTVTSIAASAFKNHKNATSAVIGKQIQTIGKQAFAGCSKLKTVSINSAKLKSIGEKAFFNCKKLTKLTVKSKILKTVGKNALKGISKKAIVKVPASKLRTYQNLFQKKGQGKQVKITN